MAVQDEILALCAELHSSGIQLTYDTIRRARGRGSRRDIAAALHEWHRRRAKAAAYASVAMPDHITDAGREFVQVLWSKMEEQFAELRREVSLETELAEHHARDEIAQLHQIIGDQDDELGRLRSEVEHLRAQLEKSG
jgi:hypothetical protein